MNLDHLEALLAKANKGMDKLDYIAIASAAPELLAAARERDRLRGALVEIAGLCDESECWCYSDNGPDADTAILEHRIARAALNPEPKP